MKMKVFLSKIKQRVIAEKDKIIFYPKRLFIRYYSKKSLVEFDENWFKGKRVAIVGAADSVLKEPLGDYIDNFDVVVRVNKGVELVETQKDFVGQKTDFLYHSLFDKPGEKSSSHPTFDLWNKHKVGLIIFSANFNINFAELNKFFVFLKKSNRKPLSQVTLKQYETTRKVLTEFEPTTGFTAINTIFNCGPAEFYLTGFTFFKTPHNKAYRDIDQEELDRVLIVEKWHSAELEYQHVKKMYQQYPLIVHPDKTLKQIFDTN